MLVAIVLVGAVVLVAARSASTTDRASGRPPAAAKASSTTSTTSTTTGPSETRPPVTPSVDLAPVVALALAPDWQREDDDRTRAIGDLKRVGSLSAAEQDPLSYLSFLPPGMSRSAVQWDAGRSARWTRGGDYLRVSVVHFLDASMASRSTSDTKALAADPARQLTIIRQEVVPAGTVPGRNNARFIATAVASKGTYVIRVVVGSPNNDISDVAIAAAQAAWDRLP